MTTDPIDSYEGMRYIHRMTQLNESEIKVLEKNGITKPIHLMLLDKHDIDSIFVNKTKKQNDVGINTTNKPASVLKQPTQQQQRKTSSSPSRKPTTSGGGSGGSPKSKSGSIAFATPIVSSGLNISNYSSNDIDMGDDDYVMNIVKRRSLASISTYLSRGGNLYKVNNIGDIVRYNTRTEKQKPYDWNHQNQHHHHSKDKESKSHSKGNKR